MIAELVSGLLKDQLNYGRIKFELNLYDLENDIGEQQTVIEEHPKVVKRLHGYIDAMREDLGDLPIPNAPWPHAGRFPGKNRRPCGDVNE